jgi:hypothetical protein
VYAVSSQKSNCHGRELVRKEGGKKGERKRKKGRGNAKR